jgi:glycosyltransferase involved in cell wall biosynthesis
MLKILHIIQSTDLNNGGPIRGILNLNSIYLNSGYSLDILTFNKDASKFDLPPNVRIINLNVLKLFNYYYCKSLTSWLEKNAKNYNKILLNGIWQNHSIHSSIVLKKLDIPYSIFPHGMLDPWSIRNSFFKRIKKTIYFYLFEYHVLKSAEFVIFTCEEECRLARSSFKFIKFNSKVIRYGMPPPPIQFAKSKLLFKSYPMLKKRKIILFLGRVDKKKGLDLLIRAFAILYKNSDQFVLLIAGSGDIGYIKELKNISGSLGVSEKVIWMGMIHDELKWSTFYSSDIFCLPSHQENFGIAIVESLSAGLPVLISNKVNIFSEISKDKAGIIFEDNLEGILNALREWNKLPVKDLLCFKQNAKKCFKKNFLLQVLKNNLLDNNHR